MLSFTVLTPTYNRARYLHRVYEGLCSQSYKDFEWIVVDDGSLDNTKELIESWQSIASFRIRYYKQKNSGKMNAVLKGVSLAKGDAIIVADSDDSFPKNAFQTFIDYWNAIPEGERKGFSGVCGLCGDPNGVPLTSLYPGGWGVDSDYLEVRYRFGVEGENWSFVKTSILRQFNVILNVYGHIPEGVLWAHIGTRFKTRFVNNVVRHYYRDAENALTKTGNPLRDCRGLLLWKNSILREEIGWFFYKPFYFFLEAARYVRFFIHCRRRGENLSAGSLPLRAMILMVLSAPVGIAWYTVDWLRISIKK